jgi:hypothetical protein
VGSQEPPESEARAVPRVDERPDAERGVHGIGKPVELFIAAYCMLASSGKLNVSTSFIDDQGVDLVFNRWGRTATLPIQVKSRTTEAGTIRDKGRFIAHVKRSTFQARTNFFVLFTVVDRPTAALGPVWLVPSVALDRRDRDKDAIRFQANVNPSGDGQWDNYSLTLAQLPSRILSILDDLAASQPLESPKSP